MKIYVIGIGLIGGSMALDLRQLYAEVEVVGIDTNAVSYTHLRAHET